MHTHFFEMYTDSLLLNVYLSEVHVFIYKYTIFEAVVYMSDIH